jgi:hypothetical protein
MATLRRVAILTFLAVVASVVAAYLPFAPLYWPALAVLLFLLLSYLLRVTSLLGSIALAVFLAILAPALFTADASEHMPWYRAFGLSLQSIGEQPVLLAFTLSPLFAAFGGYVFFRWLESRRNASISQPREP